MDPYRRSYEIFLLRDKFFNLISEMKASYLEIYGSFSKTLS